MVEIEIEKLKFFDKNPRKISDFDYENLKKSIREFGLVEPLVVNSRNYKVIGGNQRLKALKDLGYKKVNCILVDLDENKEKVLNLALNRISGIWDEELLAEMIKELNEKFDDLSLTGFNEEELERFLEENRIDVEDDFDLEEAVENVKKTKIKRGDLFELGRHRLMCGDATNEEDVKKLIGSEKINMVFTDPPYDMEIEKLIQAYNHIQHIDNQVWLMIDTQLVEFIRKTDCYITSFLVFYLTSIVPQGKYFYRRHILAIHITNHRNKYFKNLHRGFTTVIEMPYRNTFRNKIIEHEKPTESIIPILQSLSKKNNIVLDLFGGSGSTLIACERLKRRCFVMEIEPIYCQVIIDRWEELTKQKAKQIG